MKNLKPMTWSESLLNEVSAIFKVSHDFIVTALLLKGEIPELQFGDFPPVEATSYNGAKLLYEEEKLDSKKESFYLRKMIEFSLDINSDSIAKERLVFIFNCAKVRQGVFVQQLAVRSYVQFFSKFPVYDKTEEFQTS